MEICETTQAAKIEAKFRVNMALSPQEGCQQLTNASLTPPPKTAASSKVRPEGRESSKTTPAKRPSGKSQPTLAMDVSEYGLGAEIANPFAGIGFRPGEKIKEWKVIH
jgi:hypothetical protein